MSKLEKIIFYVFIFLLPLQTRQILYIWGNGFNEWTSAYLYLTDILLFFLFIFWFWRLKKQLSRQERKPIKHYLKQPFLWLVLFLVICLISLMGAKNMALGFYGWLKLLEMIGLFYYIKTNTATYREEKEMGQDKISPIKIAWIFTISVFLEGLWALVQYNHQASLGLKILTESPLALNIAGVAKIYINGLTFLRPYAGFPHPNLLAIYVLTAVFLLFFLWFRKKRSFIAHGFFTAILLFLFYILWLAFSRSILAIFTISLILYFYNLIRASKRNYTKIAAIIFLILIVFGSMIFFLYKPEAISRFSLSFQEQSVALRLLYNEIAISAVKENPYLGIGMGNFVWEIRQAANLLTSWMHQPAHNLYLLIASEIGLFGLLFFLVFIFLTLRQNRFQTLLDYSLILIFFSFLLSGLFDHFFWTLQQGQLIFWLILGIIASQRVVAKLEIRY